MFWISILYKKIFIIFLLRKNKNFKKIKEISFFFTNQKSLRKNIFASSPLYLTMKTYLNIIYFSFFINLFLFAFSDLFLIICLSYFFAYFINIVSTPELIPNFTIILFFINIIFLIRYNSDGIKTTLDPNLLNKWKRLFLIIDILTLNFISIIAFLKLKNINDNKYMKQNINLKQENLKNYQSMNKKFLFLYLIILFFSLLISLSLVILGIFYHSNILKVISLIFLLSFLFTFSSLLIVFIPTLALSYLVLKRVEKNAGNLSVATCLWLIRYLKAGLDLNIAAIFIEQIDIHEVLVNNNLYCQI